MSFETSYFQGEEREGFYIKSMMKRNWAVQLEVLHQIDIICKRHNISYWADWGTLLGAVRHKGYIPWDDDIDISMMRIDYLRFISYAKKELPQEYNINYTRDSSSTNNLICTIFNSKYDLCVSPDYLAKNYDFPYITGIDIFVYDNIPLNEDEEKLQIELLKFVGYFKTILDKKDIFTEEDKELYFKKIESLCNIHFDKEQPIIEQLYVLIDNICSMYYDIQPKEVTYFLEFMLKPELRFPIEFFSSFIEVPFEYTTIPIPEKYHEILTLEYGDYMTPVRGAATHNYPFYKQLEEKLFNAYKEQGIEIPKYLKE